MSDYKSLYSHLRIANPQEQNNYIMRRQKPEILFILHLPPPVHGAAMVGKYIHDSRLVNDTFGCHYINLATAKSLADIGRPGLGKLFRFIGLLRLIRRSVRRIRPQLVYVTPNACGAAFYKDFIVVQMLKGMSCKVVVHYHNKGVATRQDRKLDNWLYRRFFKGLKVILLSEALYPDISKYVRREDVRFCPNGIPETLAEEPCAEKHNAVPHILFLSNLIESKGVIVLLDALKILKDKGYSFICDFVGGETAEIDAARFKREVAERHLAEVAVYHGRKYGAEKSDSLHKSDIFAFPTFYSNECFPVVLLEAMQQGLPCISTDEGGITDIVENGVTGFIVQRKDADSLAEKLSLLIDNAAMRRQMGINGRKKYEKEFTYNVFEHNLVSILNEFISIS